MSRHCQRRELWKVANAIDSILIKVRQATVHVFSDSVLCLRHGSMSEASIRFTNKWAISQKYSWCNVVERIELKVVRLYIPRQPRCNFHAHIEATCGNTLQLRGTLLGNCTPETYPHRVVFMGTNELEGSPKVHHSDEVNLRSAQVIRDCAWSSGSLSDQLQQRPGNPTRGTSRKILKGTGIALTSQEAL